MMLVELPAIEAAAVSVYVPSIPSFPFSNFAIVHTLVKPSTWMVLLVTLVILSAIRAAFLFARPPSWSEGRKSVPFVSIAKEGSVPKPVAASSTTLTLPKQELISKSKPTVPAEGNKTSSWLWGLVKWDSLPVIPPQSQRGGWQPPAPQLQMQMQQPRRPGPAFNHPLPNIYDAQVPVSMAKLIMSHHTFRRPTSRPPPVRSSNVPQYQRKTPNMV